MNGAYGRWLLASCIVLGITIPTWADGRVATELRRNVASPQETGRRRATDDALATPRAPSTQSPPLHSPERHKAKEDRPSKEQPWYEIEPNSSKNPAWLGSTPRDALTQQLVGRTLVVTTVFAGIGLVVVAIAHRVQIRRRGAQQKGSMALLDTLQLAPRCTLQLIRIDSQKFLVARDGGGVRSVTPVQSFAETIDQVTTGNPLEEAVAQNDTWDQGLSLETPYRNKDVSTPRSRRIESWQENSWTR